MLYLNPVPHNMKSSGCQLLTCHQDQPVAPSEMKLQASAFEVNGQRPLREQAMIAHRQKCNFLHIISCFLCIINIYSLQ